ncbi:hypothetical protein BpHYR1_002980 [Brachionus plicatilis]|uniref:Uncharacterized protein n=1 Tax=Brachionus plicatilis TaxID=10195 RepID=A0A3M7RUU4_BRAPC|nr:hypothetical protein BpHYR1_002980 [Brachionus plicatilis]
MVIIFRKLRNHSLRYSQHIDNHKLMDNHRDAQTTQSNDRNDLHSHMQNNTIPNHLLAIHIKNISRRNYKNCILNLEEKFKVVFQRIFFSFFDLLFLKINLEDQS